MSFNYICIFWVFFKDLFLLFLIMCRHVYQILGMMYIWMLVPKGTRGFDLLELELQLRTTWHGYWKLSLGLKLWVSFLGPVFVFVWDTYLTLFCSWLCCLSSSTSLLSPCCLLPGYIKNRLHVEIVFSVLVWGRWGWEEEISKIKSFTFLLCSVAQIHSYCMCFKKTLLLDINHIKKI